MSLLPRICRTCGLSFEGGPRAWYCPTCREERVRQQLLDYKHRKSRGLTRKIGETYRCEACGGTYILSGGLQRYCDICAPIQYKSLDNSQSRAWNSAHPNEIRQSKESARNKHQAIANAVKASLYLQADLSRILTLRSEMCLSRGALAAKAGVSAQTLRDYELGRKAHPSLRKLECIAYGLGMTIRDFFRVLYGDGVAQYRGAWEPPKAQTADLGRIELLRFRKGLSAHGLSVMIGMDEKTIAELESYKRTDVQLTTLERIAAALEMEPVDLLLFLYD